MKTLVLNGSPKKNGDTVALVDAFVSHIGGDVKVISCYNTIQPCIDCRYCWSNPAQGCCLDDEMQEVYPFLDACDNIVLASPIWFSSLSGPLLNLASRLQAIWAAKYFHSIPYSSKIKNGVVILVGAQAGTESVPTQTALSIMRYMNVHRSSVQKIYSLDTNALPAEKDLAALERCREVAESFRNERRIYEIW